MPPSYEEHDQNNHFGNKEHVREEVNQSALNNNQERQQDQHLEVYPMY